MFQFLVLSFFFLSAFFCAVYAFYFVSVRHNAKKPWNLKIDSDFHPKISVLIPVHNEEATISKKLANISEVLYPKDLLEIIVVDDGSEDKTLSIVEDFVNRENNLDIKVFKQNPRVGKSAALNKALKTVSNQIIVVSDADTLWPKDIFQKALPYLADPTVGAATSVGVNNNEKESWVTSGEALYLNLVSLIRLGESKMHSTIRFEGGFCAYKKDAFDHFDSESGADDSGTALDVVQNGLRAILIPETVFYTWFPANLRGKLRIKVRRATQLIGLWVKCFRLMLRKQLKLPKKIAIPEILLFIVNPIFFILLIATGLTTVILYPFSVFSLVLVLFVLGMLVFVRRLFLEVIIDNLVLVYALFSFLFGKRYVSWENR